LRTPYDVQGWVLYLIEIDSLLQALRDKDNNNSNKKDSKLATIGGRTDMKPSVFKEYKKELIAVRISVATRATRLLPGSYKLWRNHLLFLSSQVPSSTLTWSTKRLRYTRAVEAFELCLMRLSRMPRVWLDYLHLVLVQVGPTPPCAQQNHPLTTPTDTDTDTDTNNYYTHCRRLVQRCLEALPVTQHDKIWPTVLQWAETSLPVVESALRIFRRHALYYDLTARETLAQKCVQPIWNRPGEAATLLVSVMNDPYHPTLSTKSELWMTLANVCTNYPEETLKVGIDFPRLVRSVLVPTKQSWSVVEEEVENEHDNVDAHVPTTTTTALLNLGELEGSLWAKLADYYTRMGDFDMARSTYEEGMEAVSKVRDFSILFDAYIKLEEGIMEAMMEDEDDDDDEEESNNKETRRTDDEDWDILLVDNKGATSHTADMELALARAENLISRRPILLNRVLLKQNPHNVREWLRRAELYQMQEQMTMATAALEEALTKVHARKAINGTPCQLVLALSKLYEASNIESSRNLFHRICNDYEYTFRDVDDLAQCYAAWVELELRHEAWDEALSLARQAVASPDGTATGSMAKLVKTLPKSLRLWDLLLDLEESLGTLATAKDSYSRALEIKVATPMHVLNFAAFLKDHKYFEESFSAYERGVELFTFPASKILWKAYLDDFIARYQGKKVERARDLFERCLEGCPAEMASEFCLMNGSFEEEFGLTKRALNVYKDMCQRVPKEDKYTAYQLYIAKTIKYMGVTATRDIYQEAISSLDDESAARICLDFCNMEASLQELDRARAVLTYGAQMADPRRLPKYWRKWHDFEVSHGNEETFREMLRIKRSVQAAFSTVNYNAIGMDQDMNPLSDEQAMSMIADQEGVEYHHQSQQNDKSRVSGFVAQKRKAGDAELEVVEDRVAKLRKATAGVNMVEEDEGRDEDNDEIDINDLEEDDDEAAATLISRPIESVKTKVVPASVFGGLLAASATAEAKQ